MYRQPPPPCRPSRAPVRTHLGKTAEPADSLRDLFLLFFYLVFYLVTGLTLAAWSSCPIRRSAACPGFPPSDSGPSWQVAPRVSGRCMRNHGTASRASRSRPVTITRRGRRTTEQPRYSRDEDPREGCDHAGAVSEEAAQSLRHGNHPLPHGRRGMTRSPRCAAAYAIRRPLQERQAPWPTRRAIGRAGHPWPCPAGTADGNAKGSLGCRTRVSRDATTHP